MGINLDTYGKRYDGISESTMVLYDQLSSWDEKQYKFDMLKYFRVMGGGRNNKITKIEMEENENKGNRYYLEVIGGEKVKQEYVVRAHSMVVYHNSIFFRNENEVNVAVYPTALTIVKSIEEVI